MTDSEEELVRRMRSGERAAFEELLRRTSRLVFSRLYLETGDSHQAEDLVQETYLRAFRSLSTLVENKSFRSWLLRIAQNVAIDDARRKGRQKRSAGPPGPEHALDDVADKNEAPGDGIERAEMKRYVLAALHSLPEEYRLPLTLRYLCGADYETICLQMGLTNGSLRGLLHRGLRLLREKLPAELHSANESH